MVAEILSVGTELLLGQIVDTNAAYLSGTLGELGIDVYHRVTVGDNFERVVGSIRQARDRADVIITIGGLGPTQDDLTKEAVAEAFGEELVIDQPSLDWIEGFFQRRGREMTPNNRKQALIYAHGQPIPNPNGTAPGALLAKDGKIVISTPGPPREFQPMVDSFIVPYLTEQAGGGRMILKHRILRVVGVGESALEHRILDLLTGENPTLCTLAHTGECHIRLTAKAPSVEAAEALIAPVEAELRHRLGEAVYGVDDTGLELVVVELLGEKGLSLAVAESCTGGVLGARVTSVHGAHQVFLGGVIAYDPAVKTSQLGVSAELIAEHHAASAPVARAMAAGVRERLGADIGVSITGMADRGEPGEPPAGEIYIGLAAHGRVSARECHFIGTREDVRLRASHMALELLREELLHPGRGIQ